MRVFVTGGTGLIGRSVVPELIAAGHEVDVLTRSDAAAQTARDLGANPVPGSLDDLDVLRTAAREHDGIVHLAFSNDFSSSESVAAGMAQETAALTAMASELIGTDKPIVTVSGTPMAPGRPATEDDPLPTEGLVGGRAVAVNQLLALADRGVRSAAVRLPRTVHQDGDGGFAGMLAGIARENGVVVQPGDGAQRWPAVHASDAAVLFRLVLEQAPGGTSWHAVADEGDTVASICAVIGRRLGLEVQQAPAEAFGPLAQVFALDQPASSVRTRERLGWTPTHPSLLDDLENLQP